MADNIENRTSKSQPVKGKSQPVESKSQPIEGKSKPVENKSQPIRDKSQPIKSDSKAAKDNSQPRSASSQPIKGKSKPVKRKQVTRLPKESEATHPPKGSDATHPPKGSESKYPPKGLESKRPPKGTEGKRPLKGAEVRVKRKVNRARKWATNTFFGILVVGFVLGMMFFARPTASALENRNLTEFPTLTWETFVNGSFFSDLSLWYADTFPFRDQLVGLDQAFTSLYGIEPEETMIGGNEVGDEIPTDGLEVSDREKSDSDEPEVVDVPDQRTVAADIQGNIMNGIFIKNGAAYNVYYFNQEAVQKYAAAISTCADKLAGKANVYSILAPHNSEVMLSKEELSKLSGSDESQAIDYISSLFSDNVTPVKVIEALRAHNDEYLYFRTDHHWTQLGAYYAYLEYCDEAGIEPVALEDREKMEFSPYLGSFYQQLNSNALKQNPDTVEAYVPIGTNDLRYLDENGQWQDGKIVRDLTGWNSSSYYNTFIVGDQQLLEIQNPQITDGSSVLVVKDSFANPFITLLVDNYEYVYSIDFRYYNGNIPDFVLQKGIQNVIFLQNPSIAGANSAATKLQSLM